PRGKRGEPRPEPPTIDQLFARADKLLLTPTTRNSPTAQARALFVKSEIASFRKETRLQKEYLDRIASTNAADTLPPGILGKLGDHLLEKGEIELARTVYTQIVSNHPKSIFADYGYAGLGQIALREGRGGDALRRFNDAIDLAGARFKLLEATIGQAQALLQLGRLEGAQELFEQVAGNRAWRGPATAESLYSLGEIHMKRGTPDDIAKAQAHYQRIYISYRRYTPWVAKSYLRSALPGPRPDPGSRQPPPGNGQPRREKRRARRSPGNRRGPQPPRLPRSPRPRRNRRQFVMQLPRPFIALLVTLASAGTLSAQSYVLNNGTVLQSADVKFGGTALVQEIALPGGGSAERRYPINTVARINWPEPAEIAAATEQLAAGKGA